MEGPYPTKEIIEEAAKRIAPFVHRTPVLTSSSINAMFGMELFFKCENFQKVGAFKYRGATNAVLSLSPDEKKNGVATHSSGNHAQAVALAAKINHIKAYIVMPETSSSVKINAVKGYGAEVILCVPNQKAREGTVDEIIKKTGAILIHPYNNYSIIAGQATAAKEMIEEIKGLDIIMTPVGGGGLLSGTALSTHYFSPKTIIIAGEPANADDAYRSLQKGEIVPENPPSQLLPTGCSLHSEIKHLTSSESTLKKL